ncbi:MAG: DNA polymerase IV [Trueperella sp.]|nr:DNA polymerase IV [Trueperella sp.]
MSRAPRASAAKRIWGIDDSHTNILHVDMDAFFVSVELLDYPQLRGKAVAVGGQTRGVISAASYEARKFGVNSAMPVATARRLCPQLIILPPRHDRYATVSRRIMDILYSVTPLVEPLSVDEAFLDVSGARRIFGTPTQIAQDLRARIRSQEGVTASVGIAATKHVAKIASAHAKPDGVLLVPAEATVEFLHSLPVGAIWGVGEKTREKLAGRGIYTVADLVAHGEKKLRSILGAAAGTQLYELAMGIDPRPVVPEHTEKSIGREQTFFDTVTSLVQAERILLHQSHDVARRLRKAGLLARTVAVKLRSGEFHTISRSVTLRVPTALGADIYDAAQQILHREGVPESGFRLLGVRAEQLVTPADGIQLAFDDDERREKAEAAMDSVTKRFGRRAAYPGTLTAKQQAAEFRHPSKRNGSDIR